MSRCLRYSRASRTSDRVRPNLDRKPALDFQRPAPRVASLTRTPIVGRTFSSWLWRTIDSSSVNFSTIGITCLPILRASTVILMNSSSLKPLQTMGVSGAFGQGEHGQQLGLRAGLDPEMVRLAKIEDLLDDVPLLVDLDRINAAIAPLIIVLANGRAEGIVDLADAMAEDVREPQQDRQLNAALLELIDQLLQVDRLAGILVGMNRHVPLGIDPEIILAPVANAVRFQGIIDLPRIGKSMFRTLRHSRALLYSLMVKRRVSPSLAVMFNFDFREFLTECCPSRATVSHAKRPRFCSAHLHY